MKLLDLCLVSNADMVIYEGYFGVEIARIDSKNGVSTPILDSEIGYISVNNYWVHIEVNFSVYEFLKNNFNDLKGIVKDYIDFSGKDIQVLCTPYGDTMFRVKDIVYTFGEFKTYILSDDEYLLHITKNWNNYESEWDL